MQETQAQSRGQEDALKKEMGFPHSSVSKESACIAGDLGLTPQLGRSPGERNGNPLQYSCLGNPMNRGAWQAANHGVTRPEEAQSWLNFQKSPADSNLF